MHRTSRMYHHTPELSGPHAPGFGILEMAARDAARAMLGVFRLAVPEKEEVAVRPRGIDAGRMYEVMLDNSGARVVVSGFELAQRGLTVRLDGSLTSGPVLLRATP